MARSTPRLRRPITPAGHTSPKTRVITGRWRTMVVGASPRSVCRQGLNASQISSCGRGCENRSRRDRTRAAQHRQPARERRPVAGLGGCMDCLPVPMLEVPLDRTFIEVGQLQVSACRPTQEATDHVEASPNACRASPSSKDARRSARQAVHREKWLRNFGRWDKWIVCLAAGTVVPANQEKS